jgi:SAM-dependent methyltransferase
VELSESTADACRKRVGNRAEVIVGNIETGEGFEGRTFDAVVGVSVLDHVNMSLFLENTLLAALQPGGRFAFSEPNMANPQVWATKNVGALGRLLHETPHETAFRTGELRGLFEGAGLDVEICEPFDFLHPSTPRALIPAVRRLGDVLEKTPARGIAGSIRIAGRKP